MTDPVASAPPPLAADDAVLVGREQERAWIDALLDRATAGRSGVLGLRGEAGIGKSALIEYAVARAREREMRVVSAVCVEAEAELPFSALHQLLRPLGSCLPSLVDAHRRALEGALGLSAERVEDRFLVGAAMLGLLASGAESQPLLCVVDDAHWLDRASREALIFAARRLEAEGVALVLAERPDQRPGPGHDLPTLSVPPLSADDARSLLARRYATGLSQSVRDRLVRSAVGNPLALVEFAGALTEEQRRGHDPLPEPLFVSGGIEDAYRHRVTALPGDTQMLLLLAAAEGAGDAAVVLGAAGALGLDAAALEPAEAGRLVRVIGERLEFRHPLVRSAVYATATVNDRLRAHRALADVLVRSADADRRAWHLAAATIGTDEQVADALERTAERAVARGGFAAFSSAMERAARLTGRDELRARRLVLAAEGAVRAGESERSLALLEEVGDEVEDPLSLVTAAQVRGMIELRTGVPGAAVPLFLSAAEEAASFDGHLAITLAMRAAEAAAVGGELERVAEMLEWVTALGELDRADDRLVLHLLQGLADLYGGDAAESIPAFRLAVGEADAVSDPTSLYWAATAANYLGERQRAEALYRAAVDWARAAGELYSLPLLLVGLAATEYGRGARATAEADAAEGLRLARETGQEPIRAYALAMLAHTAAMRGADDECALLAAEALEIALPRRLRGVATSARYALVELDLAVGRSLRALERLEALLEDPETHPVYRVFATPALVEAGTRAGWPDRIRPWFERYEQWAVARPESYEGAILARCRAFLADGAASEEHFEEALRLHAASPQPFERARTQLAYGEFCRRARRKSDARVQLRAALETFEALGTTAWAERARGELRATGETARRRSDDTRGDLTPQELQVARLVAAGATNRAAAAQLFLSPKTVEYHLHKVFTKLGVSSRTELARLDLERDDAAAAV